MNSGEIIPNMNEDTSLSSEEEEQTSKIIENDPTGRFSKVLKNKLYILVQ